MTRRFRSALRGLKRGEMGTEKKAVEININDILSR